MTICGTSPRFVRALSQMPLLLETLATNTETLAGARLNSPLPTTSLLELKSQEETRAGIRHVLGFTTFGDLTEELSQLADVILTSVFEGEARKFRMKNPPLAVFALGKYGTRELGFDADLDVLFISFQASGATSDRLERVAGGIVRSLSQLADGGRLYEIDARLRPEGRNAPLVVDRKFYATYLEARASLWERQSLTRLRFVCGDQTIAHDVMREVESFVYDTPLPGGWVDTIVSMRRKIETRSRTQATDYFDIKLGPGGLVDIEFFAQIIQLKFGREIKSLRGKNTEEVMNNEHVRESKPVDLQFLLSSYQFYRRIELLMRITLEDRGTLLPQGEKLELLARCMGTTGVELRERVASGMQHVRRAFLDACRQFATS